MECSVLSVRLIDKINSYKIGTNVTFYNVVEDPDTRKYGRNDYENNILNQTTIYHDSNDR